MKKLFTLMISMLIMIIPFAVSESVFDRTISFESDSFYVYIGKQIKISAKVSNLIDSAPQKTVLVWSSSDDNIATVNDNGQVSGKSSGTATITAYAKDNESISASAKVEVRVPVQTVTINEKNVSILYKSTNEPITFPLTVTISPENAFHQSGSWASSNEKIASVDDNGIVTANGIGNVNITFTSDDPNGNKKTQTQIKIVQAIEGIELEENVINVPVNQSKTIKAVISPATAANKKLNWSTEDETVAIVSANGQVKGVSPGSTNVTISSTDGSLIFKTCKVNVVVPVKKITLNEKKVTLAPGTEWQVLASVVPEDATINSLAWTSSNESVATVDQNGIITGIAKGTSNITASAQDGSGMKMSIQATVKDFDIVITNSNGATVNYQTPNGIWGIGFKSKNKCVTDDSEHLSPLKAGEDTFTISMQSYMTGKIKRQKYKVFVAPSAVGIKPIYLNSENAIGDSKKNENESTLKSSTMEQFSDGSKGIQFLEFKWGSKPLDVLTKLEDYEANFDDLDISENSAELVCYSKLPIFGGATTPTFFFVNNGSSYADQFILTRVYCDFSTSKSSYDNIYNGIVKTYGSPDETGNSGEMNKAISVWHDGDVELTLKKISATKFEMEYIWYFE